MDGAEPGWTPDPTSELEVRTVRLISAAMTRKNGEDLFSETTPEGMWEMAPLTCDLVRFVVSLGHPNVDLDWVADKALEYTGE